MDAMNIMTVILQAIFIGLVVATVLLNTGRGLKAIELYLECLIFLNNELLIKGEELPTFVNIFMHETIFKAYRRIPDYTKALIYGRELLKIYRECSKKEEEGKLTLAMAEICQQQYRYEEARVLYVKAIKIMKKMGDRKNEAFGDEELGMTSYRIGEYGKANEYLEKALAIRIQIGDKQGEASDYRNLGTVFQSLGEYDKAKEYVEKALAINIQIGDKQGEAAAYGNLGTLFKSLGQYGKAQEYLQKALAITIQIGDKQGEAAGYGNLGTVFQSLGQYGKAKEFVEKALAINIQIGDKQGEAAAYGHLGTLFKSLGQYGKAQEYLQKALAITIQIGDKEGEASDYRNLGTVFKSLGQYGKAQEYLQKALAITIQIGDKEGEAADYGNLGTVFKSLGQYGKAKEFVEKALAITIQIGDKQGEAADYAHLGALYHSLGEYDKAKEYLQKALAITIQIGHKQGEAAAYGNLGAAFQCLGKYDKAKEYLQKALAIKIQIGDKQGEAVDYVHLGALYHSLGEYVMAEGYIETALSISRDIEDLDTEFHCLSKLSVVKLCQCKRQEACDYLFQCMNISETLRSFLEDNDDFKASSSDVRGFPYWVLSALFCFWANPNHALYVLELARARALADLMATQYSIESQITADPQSWIGIESIMKKESNSSCLYISYYDHDLFFWVLKTSGIIHFRRITVDEKLVGARVAGELDDFFATSFRSFGILSQEDCEDRSLSDVEKFAALRLIEEEDEESQNSESSEALYYRMLINPVADLFEDHELIVVPDRFLNQVPFAALTDEGGRYLSEKFRIRIVPSLTTLKLIQDSHACYQSQTSTDALIVGDPVVGMVRYKGTKRWVSRLPCAGNEATMIGRLLGVQPLLGRNATKQVVLDRLHSVRLIHFAAHGYAERGEIALSPVGPPDRVPEEEDYLLTMSDVAKVQLQAKLVVLSCCHSARGQI